VIRQVPLNPRQHDGLIAAVGQKAQQLLGVGEFLVLLQVIKRKLITYLGGQRIHVANHHIRHSPRIAATQGRPICRYHKSGSKQKLTQLRQ